MQHIEFLEDYTVRDQSGTQFTAGQVVAMDPASARHFVNKGIAKVCEAPVPAAKPRKKALDE